MRKSNPQASADRRFRRGFIRRVVLGIGAVWASLAIVFVLTGGGDGDAVLMLTALGVAGSAGHLSGEWERYEDARHLARGVPPTPGRSFRRLAVLAAVGGVLIAATVLMVTPRAVADWAFGVTVWAAGFAGLAAADALGWAKAERNKPRRQPE